MGSGCGLEDAPRASTSQRPLPPLLTTQYSRLPFPPTTHPTLLAVSSWSSADGDHMELEELLAAAHDELLAAAQLEAAELAAAEARTAALQQRFDSLAAQFEASEAAVAEREAQVADLQRQLEQAQAQAAELAIADSKLKRQAQTVAELAAAQSKLLTTESRLAKLQDRHAALQQQYQAAQKTAAEWEAAGARRQVRPWLCGVWGLCVRGWVGGLHCAAALAPALQAEPRASRSPTCLLAPAHPPPSRRPLPRLPLLQEETDVLLKETQAKLAAVETEVRCLGECPCLLRTAGASAWACPCMPSSIVPASELSTARPACTGPLQGSSQPTQPTYSLRPPPPAAPAAGRQGQRAAVQAC